MYRVYIEYIEYIKYTEQGRSQDFSKGGGTVTLCQTLSSWRFRHGISRAPQDPPRYALTEYVFVVCHHECNTLHGNSTLVCVFLKHDKAKKKKKINFTPLSPFLLGEGWRLNDLRLRLENNSDTKLEISLFLVTKILLRVETPLQSLPVVYV